MRRKTNEKRIDRNARLKLEMSSRMRLNLWIWQTWSKQFKNSEKFLVVHTWAKKTI